MDWCDVSLTRPLPSDIFYISLGVIIYLFCPRRKKRVYGCESLKRRNNESWRFTIHIFSFFISFVI